MINLKYFPVVSTNTEQTILLDRNFKSVTYFKLISINFMGEIIYFFEIPERNFSAAFPVIFLHF